MLNHQLTPEIQQQYQTANPFPHIVVDNFLEETLVNQTIESIKNMDSFYVYRASFLNPSELKLIKDTFDSKGTFIRIHNEFISTTLNESTLDKLDSNCLIQLEIKYDDWEKPRFNYDDW